MVINIGFMRKQLNAKSERKEFMKIKRIASVLMSMIMVMALVSGCGAGNQETNSEKNTSDTTAATTVQDESTGDSASANKTTDGKGKVLVVYYSATGSTKAVAQTIADTANGDLFEIEPKEPYTDDDLDWTNDDSRVSREHNDEGLRNVELKTTSVDNWDSYDTVFIGYPIWWGIAAWPVDNFVKNNDFSGKKVIPFCTSASSGLGDSGELLAELAGTGDWQDGERFSSGASDDEVSQWVSDLGYSK